MRLNPMNDFVFKKLLGEKGSEEELLAFLNAVLHNAGKAQTLAHIEIIENKELSKQLTDEKCGRLDVRAVTPGGIQFDIEVQLRNYHNMDKRTLFYWGKLFLDSIHKGDNYDRLSRAITINLLDFEFLSINKFHSCYHLWEDESRFMLTDIIEIHFIEMAKFRKLKCKKPDNDPLHRWLMFFDKDVDSGRIEELIQVDNAIKKANDRLNYLSSDEETIALTQARENARIEYNSAISYAERKGMQKGVQKGVQLGMQKGMQKGVLKAKREYAKNMLMKGLDIPLISDITGLSMEEIDKIKQEQIQEQIQE